MFFKKLVDLELSGRRVFIRSDLNVPINQKGEISDDSRLVASCAAIQHCLKNGGAVMVASHFGRPKAGSPCPENSLAPIVAKMEILLERPIPLIRGWLSGTAAWDADGLGAALQEGRLPKAGEVVILENCRFNPGEVENDAALSREMALLCDVYVNDAFGAAHRSEATTSGMAEFAPVACAGPLMSAELAALSTAFENPKRPFVAVVGGSKVSSKLPILQSLAKQVDALIVGGGLGNTFALAYGHSVGQSLVEPAYVEAAKGIGEQLSRRGAFLQLPIDVVCTKAFHPDAVSCVKSVQAILADERILDWGPESRDQLFPFLQNAGTIIWNGPLGVFEWEAFSMGTRTLARAIAQSAAFSVAGGGETLAAIRQFGVREGISYISTGGGAFLSFLEGKPLPAVAALLKRAS